MLQLFSEKMLRKLPGLIQLILDIGDECAAESYRIKDRLTGKMVKIPSLRGCNIGHITSVRICNLDPHLIKSVHSIAGQPVPACDNFFISGLAETLNFEASITLINQHLVRVDRIAMLEEPTPEERARAEKYIEQRKHWHNFHQKINFRGSQEIDVR